MKIKDKKKNINFIQRMMDGSRGIHIMPKSNERIIFTPVTQEERERLRVPTYEYIL
jgi:hypothetical protein